MLIQKLLSSVTSQPLPIFEISNITEDTRRADPNSLFVCIRGTRFDGHALAHLAYKNGCRFFVAQESLSLPADAFVIFVKDTRRTLSTLAATFYGFPSEKMHVIGITGTKGKTTTAHLIRGILEECGISCGYIGTNGIFYKNVRLQTQNTTPDALTLQKTLADMHSQGTHVAVLEVSSQALMQARADGVRFKTVIFTNLSPDHVGPSEHASFEDYKSCKHRLFTDFGAEHAIWNADDPAHADMRCNTTAKKETFCSLTKKDADYRVQDIQSIKTDTLLGISFSILHGNNAYPTILPLVGECNAFNALLSVAVAHDVFEIPLSDATRVLSSLRADGRSECYPLPTGAMAVIDYAHNEESLRSILTALRAYHPNRLICLFGSVGERSQMRRTSLGSIAASLADFSILTSDNPGKESPEKIIDEIATAFDRQASYCKITDRHDAILHAIKLSKKGDILLLAGKGHETYQLIGNEKIPFDERKILATVIETSTLSTN